MSRTSKERVAVYIDGFNIYHAINDIKKSHLKWLNLMKLANLLIKKRSQRIVYVKYFSAYANHFGGTPQVGSLLRHRIYVKALEAKGVNCFMGNFAKRDRIYSGRGYKARWRRYEEKQTDVGIAVHLINDAHHDLFDKALVVSVDTDLLPVFDMMSLEFPLKPVICVAPPRRSHHREIQARASSLDVIQVSQIERALFGPTVVKNGKIVARRAPEYKPPRNLS